MQNNQDMIRQAMRLAQTPAGQQLIRMLQASNDTQLQNVMNNAASGDYASAKKVLSELLNNPEAQKLISQMGGSHGPDGR